MKKVVLLGAGVLALGLGACDKLPFFKVSSPQRKPGLWQQTIQSDRMPAPVVSKWCYDAASDRRTPVLPRGPRRAGSCSKFEVAKSGDGYTVDSVCGFGGPSGPSITSHAAISGDYQTKYTIVSSVDVANSPDPSRNGTHKTTVTAVYMGACPPEIGPGQVQLPNGDVVDAAALRGGFGRGGGGGGGPGGGGPPANGAAGPPAGGGGGGPPAGGGGGGGGPPA